MINNLDPLRSLIRMLKSVSLNKSKQWKRESEVQKRENRKVVYRDIMRKIIITYKLRNWLKKIKGCMLRQNQDLTYCATHSTRLANFNVHYRGLKGNASPGDVGRELEPHELLTS